MPTNHYPGFYIAQSQLDRRLLQRWYGALCARADDCDIRGVGHFVIPPEIDLDLIRNDRAVDAAISACLPGGTTLVHAIAHVNSPGATPLDWHSDDCLPWFAGEVEDAPPAVRIWFFPQDTPVDRGPIQLVPTGCGLEEAVTAECSAGGFVAVYDMGLVHRQMANTSDQPRFMVRLEFNEE